MAGRPIGRRHQDDVRGKIQASHIIKRLSDYFNGDIDIDVGRVNAAKILLNKVLPDLTAISGDPNGEPFKAEIGIRFIGKQ